MILRSLKSEKKETIYLLLEQKEILLRQDLIKKIINGRISHFVSKNEITKIKDFYNDSKLKKYIDISLNECLPVRSALIFNKVEIMQYFILEQKLSPSFMIRNILDNDTRVKPHTKLKINEFFETKKRFDEASLILESKKDDRLSIKIKI